jgi:hypothetical protein
VEHKTKIMEEMNVSERINLLVQTIEYKDLKGKEMKYVKITYLGSDGHNDVIINIGAKNIAAIKNIIKMKLNDE